MSVQYLIIFFLIFLGARAYPADVNSENSSGKTELRTGNSGVSSFSTTKQGETSTSALSPGSPQVIADIVVTIIKVIFNAECGKVDAAMNGKYLFI